jgi:translation initiation factor 1
MGRERFQAAMTNSRRVYSTEEGRINRPAPPRVPAPAGPKAPNDGVVRIFRDRSGRNGKVVTVIRGLPARDLEARAAELKRLCGAGGAVKDGAVEIQGDHRERIAEQLRSLGYTVKLAGG